MASTKQLTASGSPPAWRQAGWPYYACHLYLRQRFGQRVQKVSVDAGLTCPNVDGTVATGGCNFCDNRSFSPSRRLPRMGISGQLDAGIARMQTRYRNCRAFLAYFQPATNTYAPVERLRTVYEEALAHPLVVGLAIGTRPDCVPDDVLDLLEELAKRGLAPSSSTVALQTKHGGEVPVPFSTEDETTSNSRDPTGRRRTGTYVSLDLGMQTMHDRSLDWMNRGHHHDAMIDAVDRCRGRGFDIGSHVILGLPGESHDDMLATAQELGRLDVDAVKIHNLYCVKDTRLADDVAVGRVRLMERDEFVRTLVDFIELLPPTMVIDRISGDAPRDFFVGPDWCLDKAAVKAAVLAEFKRRGSFQGQRFHR